jgi:hypothetical protein
LLRHHLAQALFALGQKSEAEKLISRMEDVHSEFGPWMALHGRWLEEQGESERAAAAFAPPQPPLAGSRVRGQIPARPAPLTYQSATLPGCPVGVARLTDPLPKPYDSTGWPIRSPHQ